MPHPLFSEIIGFIFLIVLISTASIGFSLHLMAIQIESTKVTLNDVANYVALSLTDIASLANSTHEENLFLIKVLNLPYEVNGLGYYVKIDVDGDKWVIIAYSYTSPWLKGEAELWSTQDIQVETSNGEFTEYNVKYYQQIPSGLNKPAVWCRKSNGVITVGIGEVKE